MAEAIQATAETQFPTAKVPTMYFIGMTTGKSSIMTVFPRWAEHLGLADAVIRGIDCKWHDQPDVYRNVVRFIKEDELSQGALVSPSRRSSPMAIGNRRAPKPMCSGPADRRSQ